MSEIRAGTTSTTALVTTADTTGNIVLTPDSGVARVNTTGAFGIPVGTTAQRPASPLNGDLRINTTTNATEIYYGGFWITVSNLNYSPTYLIVAGGGGGGGNWGGGGGAGGLLTGTQIISAGFSYAVTVGAGGTGGAYNGSNGGNGGNSSVFSLTAIAGGGGGTGLSPGINASSGGSGGGGGYANYTGGARTAGQGNAGANQI